MHVFIKTVFQEANKVHNKKRIQMIMALWDVTPCKFINWDHFRHTC